jgi:hypothetical protein
MRNIDIKYDKISNRADQIYDRLSEIEGELTTIKFKADSGLMNIQLAYLQISCLEYESELLLKESIEVIEDLEVMDLLLDLDLDIESK